MLFRSVREAVVADITSAVRRTGFIVAGVIPCPVLGAEGNQEYLLYGRYAPGTESAPQAPGLSDN